MRSLAAILVAAVGLLAGCAPQGPAGSAPSVTPAPAARATARADGAATSAATGPATPTAPAVGELLNVKYAYAPRLPMIPVFVAQEKGYFAEQGVEVDFVPFLGGSNEMLAPMSQGQLDVAAAGISAGMVNAAADGIVFRIVADQGQIARGRSVYNIAVRSDVVGKFNDVSDLRGSTGGVAAIDSGLSLPYTFSKIAQAAGLTTPDGLEFANFTFVETPGGGQPDQIAMFQNKAQEWQLVVEPTPALFEERGVGTRWKRTDELVRDPLQAYTLLYGERFIKDKPEAAQRFMVAYVKGLRYFNDNYQTNAAEINAIASKHAKVSEAVIERSVWAYYDPNARVDVRSLQDQHDFWKAKGLIRKGRGGRPPLPLGEGWG